MTLEKRELVTLRFTGARFDDHGLDVDVLPELIAYKRLLIETAKEVWRRRNPDRQRLPRGFDTGLMIKFFGLAAGSTSVPLMREIDATTAPMLPFSDQFGETDEIDEATTLLGEAIDCADKNLPAPASFPSSIVPLFESFGQCLRDEETITLTSVRQRTDATYNGKVRARILEWIEPVFTDQVELTGEVRSADLDGTTFAIRLDDGRKVRGPFASHQERIILEALGDHESRQLRVRGTGEFAHSDGKIRRLTDVESILIAEPKMGRADYDSAGSLLSMVGNISAAVPGSAWAAVPTDLAENLDHYLYGRRRETK